MIPLVLHDFHRELGAGFIGVNGMEAVEDYGNFPLEHAALKQRAGVLDLGFRSRICLTGADRVRFLHGQVTNDIKRLGTGQGCYAALVTAKGRMQSDLNVYCLSEELLLDFEPGLTRVVSERLERFIVADDVQVVEVAPHYGLLSVQGPKAAEVIAAWAFFRAAPAKAFEISKADDPTFGEIYLARRPRLRTDGFDLFIPVSSLVGVAHQLNAVAKSIGGQVCGWRALEMARIEAGIPLFGVDMDETNLPQECGIEAQAVNYTKGCYIGQEVLNRVHTMGHVNRELRGLVLAEQLRELPRKGDKLLDQERELGFITSAVRSARWGKNLALGYVRRERSQAGTQLTLASNSATSQAVVVDLPFHFEDQDR